jgi:hypothetical protein
MGKKEGSRAAGPGMLGAAGSWSPEGFICLHRNPSNRRRRRRQTVSEIATSAAAGEWQEVGDDWTV